MSDLGGGGGSSAALAFAAGFGAESGAAWLREIGEIPRRSWRHLARSLQSSRFREEIWSTRERTCFETGLGPAGGVEESFLIAGVVKNFRPMGILKRKGSEGKARSEGDFYFSRG